MNEFLTELKELLIKHDATIVIDDDKRPAIYMYKEAIDFIDLSIESIDCFLNGTKRINKGMN